MLDAIGFYQETRNHDDSVYHKMERAHTASHLHTVSSSSPLPNYATPNERVSPPSSPIASYQQPSSPTFDQPPRSPPPPPQQLQQSIKSTEQQPGSSSVDRFLAEGRSQQHPPSPSVNKSPHPARDYDIKHKLSTKHRRHENEPQHQQHGPLAGSPGTVRQRPKEKKSTGMKDAEVIAKLRTICIEDNPSKIYRNMTKIGQG